MKKKVVFRGMQGFPIGIAIGYIITICISLGWANGDYVPCVPELITATGSEIKAVTLQAFLCGVLGSGFAASSAIWEMENWGILKQTGVYFSVISVIMLPIAYFSYWMEHSVMGFLSYFGIFALIFAVFWVFGWISGKRNVSKMNKKLQNAKDDHE